MTRTVAIEQPNYIPWLGYFDLIRQSDAWIWYDDVQYTKRDWRNRNRIADGGEPLWLTIPVKTKGRFEQTIREVEIDDSQPWRRRHQETLRRCYAVAPHAGAILPLLTRAIDEGHTHLAELTITLNESICALLGLAPSFARSSELVEDREPYLFVSEESGQAGLPARRRQDRLLDLCRAAGGTTYLSGPAARAYIEPRGFEDAGVELRYIVYDYPPYARGPRPFVPNLSIVDAIAWLGPEAAVNFLEAHGRSENGP